MAALGMLKISSFNGVAVQAKPSQARPVAAAIMPIRASQSLQGVVVSTIGEKTAVVAVKNLMIHPIYKKRVNNTKKYIAHVDEQQCSTGDVVILSPTRPLSKSKRFTVSEIVKKAQ